MADSSGDQGIGITEDETKNMTPVEQLMHAAANGNSQKIAELVNSATALELNINAIDAHGMSAMNHAVKNGFLLPILTLIDAGVEIRDTMLRAVDCDFQEAVKYLINHASTLPPDERDAILKCKSETTDIHPDVTPIIRAAQKNNFTLVKILHDAGLRIEELNDDDLATSTNDSFQRSVGTLEIYRALASPAYVCFDPDPIGRAFHLSSLLRKMALLEVEFKLKYLELANGMEQYAADIISYTVTTEEAMAMLAYHGKGNSRISQKAVKALGLLPTINRAITHDQKKFVAEPTCQHILRVEFSRQLIVLQDRPFVFSIFLRILIILLFPVLCIVYKIGISKTCNDFVKIPMVKFFMQLGSDLLLLGMIMFELKWSTRKKEEDSKPWKCGQSMTKITPLHYLIYFYALGMLWREILYIWKKRHQRNVVKIMNVVNIIIGLLLLAYVNNQITMITWDLFPTSENCNTSNTNDRNTNVTVAADFDRTRDYQELVLNYTGTGLNASIIGEIVGDLFRTIYMELDDVIYEVNITMENYVEETVMKMNETLEKVKEALSPAEDPTSEMNFDALSLMSRAIMSLIVVISFTRIQPYFIAIDSVGPLSISFKSMFTTTGQFLSVVVAVLFGFATGLTYIYADSYIENDSGGTGGAGQSSCSGSGGRGGSCSDTNYYENILQSMLTLYWSLFGLISKSSVESDKLPEVMVYMGNLLYASFYVFTVLVLLNALIAVMSNVYNVVEENADTEWKFHRTYLWMSFLDETFTVPPPFNLVPQLDATVKKLFRRLKRCCGCLFGRRKKGENIVTSHRDEISMDSIPDLDVTTDSQSDPTNFCRVDERTYKRVSSTLVERYIAERTSHERKLEGDITVADMRNLKNDVVGLRYNLFREVWCINEKLRFGHTESDIINTEMTTVQDVFNALAMNKRDFQNFERKVTKWLKHMVERLRNLPDIEEMAAAVRGPATGSVRRRVSGSVEEMVDYYESLKRRKTNRKKRHRLLNELLN